MPSSPKLLYLLAALFMAAAAVGTAAPASAPAADCPTALLSLADCLSFVEEGSKTEKPAGQCCAGLKKVVKDEAPCLCQAFNGGADFGIKINMTKAMTLPHVCRVSTPPISNCKSVASGAPASAPAPFARAPATSPVTGGSIAGVPAAAPGTHSNSPSLRAASWPLLCCVSVALFSLFI